MLVLSRREREKIVFPAIDASVEVLEIKPGRVRLGVQAPAELQVLRDEVLRDGGAKPGTATPPRADLVAAQQRKQRHALRNQLNSATVGFALLRRQIEAGLFDSAQSTLNRIASSFESLGPAVDQLTATPPSAASRTPQPEALLVEDDSNECELLAGLLRLAGYKVTTVGDGAAALEHLRAADHRPDVMLLDMHMPRCDGPTTARMIRDDPTLAGIKIVAVSGDSPEGLGLRLDECGIDSWFQKPLNTEALLGKLRSTTAIAV